MHHDYAEDVIKFLSNGICTLVSLFTCSTLLFIICAKKSPKSNTSIPDRPDENAIDLSSYPQPSTIYYRDNLNNTKKTDLIRQGKLKVDKKDPDYDTMLDIERQLSLEKMDVSPKTQPTTDDEHIYEIIQPEMRKSASPRRETPIPNIKPTDQTPSKLALPIPRRDSNPQPVESNLSNKTIVASKTKNVKENPSKRVSFISVNQVQSLVVRRLSKEKNKAQILDTAPGHRRHSTALVKEASKVGGNVLKPSQSFCTKLGDAANRPATVMKKTGTKILYSQYVEA